MNEAKFSKGEWSLSDSLNENYWYIDILNDKESSHHYAIAEICVKMAEGSSKGKDYDDELKANAFLMYKAKKMYEMLESNFKEIKALINSHDKLQEKLNRSDSLELPEKWDQESLHDIQFLLAEARGEIK